MAKIAGKQLYDIPKTMKAVVYYTNSDVRLEERQVPEIEPGEILVKTEAVGLCGSELTEYHMASRAPLVMGHEPAGVVAKIGEGVTRFKVGDRVVVHHHVGCMSCHHCHRGNFTLCQNFKKSRLYPGGACEYFRVPEENTRLDTLLLPENVSFEVGTLVEPIGCAMRGVKITPIRPGDTVLVVGMGFVGRSYLELIRHSPAGKIVVTDLNDWRLEEALKHGATHAINSAKEDPVEKLKEINNGYLADEVFVIVPNIKVWNQGIALAEKGATVHFGTPMPPDIEWAIHPNKLWFDEIKFTFTYSTSHVEMAAVLDMIAAGRMDVECLITHRFGMHQVPEAIRMYAEAGPSLKQLIIPSLTEE